MVFTGFFEADSYTAYPDNTRSLNLSFAIWLVDDFTKEKPIGLIQVELKGTGKKAFSNLSGYYLFSDLEARNYTVTIKSELYFPEEIKDAMSAVSDPKNPVVEVNGKPEVVLKPNPGYPFPASTTLVRGSIESVSGKSVAGLKVRIKGKDMENLTDSRGEFVLYFKNVVKTEDVIFIINEEAGEHIITAVEGKTVSEKKILIQ